MTRLLGYAPAGHGHTTTLIAALDYRGIRCSTTVDGAVNRDVFKAFIGQVLVPTLQPGQVVVMNNLSSHKGRHVGELIESAGATLLYLPLYAPDLNLIETAFSTIKQLLRSLAARTRGALWNNIHCILERITASDAHSYFTHAGYATRQKMKSL